MAVFTAHVMTSNALGESPEVLVVMAVPPEAVGDVLIRYPLAVGGDFYEVLVSGGWWAGRECEEVQPGYFVVPVEVRDYEKILGDMTRAKAEVEAQLRAHVSCWNTFIGEALDANVPVSRIAGAAGVSVQRVYQMRDQRAAS